MRQAHAAASESHLDLLKRLVASQRPAQDFIKALLEMMVRATLSTTWEGQPTGVNLPFKLEFFGSRRYGVPLPSSDVDIVCILPEEFHIVLSKKVFLSRMLHWIKREPLCTRVTDACKHKSTVEFRCAGMKVDFTLHVGDDLSHSPLALTLKLKQLLDSLPQLVRDLCLLTIDWAKRSGACFKGKGPIGKMLKGVHWLLLTLAFVLAPRENPLPEAAPLLLQKLFVFYSKFKFEQRIVDANVLWKSTTENPFPHRVADTASMWLRCPLDATRNLAEHVDTDFLTHTRKLLLEGVQSMHDHSFWVDANHRWQSHSEAGPLPAMPQGPAQRPGTRAEAAAAVAAATARPSPPAMPQLRSRPGTRAEAAAAVAAATARRKRKRSEERREEQEGEIKARGSVARRWGRMAHEEEQ